MKGFRKSYHHDLETELRESRPQPRPEFLSAVTRDSRQHGSRGRARRTGLAIALSVGMLAASASLGGISYAASAAKQVLTVSKVATPSTSSGAPVSKSKPDDDQYKPGKGCGDKNHVHSRENECKKPPK